MSSGTNTSTSNNAPPAAFTNAYTNVTNQATGVAGTPLQTYPGQVVADMSPDQQAGIAGVQNAQGAASPYINSAASYIDQATTPIWGQVQQFSPSTVNQYESPYTSDVVNATQAEFNNQNAQQQSSITGNAASEGALGGDRSAVAQGIAAGQEQLAQAPVIAGLENQGYSQALNEFNTQQGSQLGATEANAWLNSQAGAAMGNLGQEALGTELTGANAELGIGGLEQTQAQSELNVPYEEYLAQQAYPFQTTGWLANIDEGLGGASGGTSSTTSPGPSVASQVGGGALAGVGILGQTGAFGSAQNGYNGYLTNLAGSGGGGAGAEAGLWDSARGGAIPHRAPGGGLSSFDAPGAQPISVSTGVPNVGISVVPGASGMGDPATVGGTQDILKNYGTTSTTSGGPNTTLGAIGGIAGGIVGGIYGGPVGGYLGSTAGSAVGSALAAGGGISPFPIHRTRAPGTGIGPISNDNFHRPPGMLAPMKLAAGGSGISMIPSTHGGPPIPQLTGTGIAAAPSNVNSYLANEMGRAYTPSAQPSTPSTLPAPIQAPPGLSPAQLAIDNGEFDLGLGQATTSTGGNARGGIVRRDEGGDVPSEGAILSDVLSGSPSSGPISPAEAAANFQLHGYSPAGIAGITQNMNRESGFDPTAKGDLDANGTPTSRGLFQHHGEREAALVDFAKANGSDPTNPYVQMQFARHELETKYPGLNKELKTTGDAGRAESDFRTQFERPRVLQSPSMQATGPDAGSGIFSGATTSQPSGGGIGAQPLEAPAAGPGPWRTLTNVGLGIMGGTSPQAGVNIGRGALQGVTVSDKEQQTEATQALAREQARASSMYRQADLTLKQAQLAQSGKLGEESRGLETQRLNQTAAQSAAQQQIERDRLTEAAREHDQTANEGRYTATPVTMAAPDDPTKTISGVNQFNTKTGETKFIRTDTNPNKIPSAASVLPDETRGMIAERVMAGDTGALQGLGYGTSAAQNRMAIQTEIAHRLQAQGLTGADLAAKTAEYMGERAGARTAGTREANVGMAVTEAQNFMPLALSASAAVDRTQFPTLNSIVQAYDKGTGDENVVRLAVATNSLVNAYSRAITPSGVPTEGNQTRARELLDKAWSQGQYSAAVDQLMKEMVAAKASPIQQEEEQRARISGRTGQTAPPSQTAPVHAPVIPPLPSGVPAGSQYSPSRNQWRDPSGKIYPGTQ